jgi:hypothetical protein
VRCTESQKGAFKKAADRDARTMSAWFLKLGLDKIHELGIQIEESPASPPAKNRRRKEKKQKGWSTAMPDEIRNQPVFTEQMQSEIAWARQHAKSEYEEDYLPALRPDFADEFWSRYVYWYLKAETDFYPPLRPSLQELDL